MIKILLVDDEIITRKTLSLALAREGYDVVAAEDGSHAIRLLKKYTPDVVVTDIIMPERNGIEVILEIKRNYPSIRVIAISGGGRLNANTHLNIARDLGVAAIMLKPIKLDELKIAIENCLLGF